MEASPVDQLVTPPRLLLLQVPVFVCLHVHADIYLSIDMHTYIHTCTHTHTHTHLFKSISMMYTTNAFIAAAVTVVTAGDGAEARGPPRLGDSVRGRG